MSRQSPRKAGRSGSSAGKRAGKSPAQVRRAAAQRTANARAKAQGRPLPHPNLWGLLDPTKAPAGATDEQIRESYLRFRALCPPPARKRLDP